MVSIVSKLSSIDVFIGMQRSHRKHESQHMRNVTVSVQPIFETDARLQIHYRFKYSTSLHTLHEGWAWGCAQEIDQYVNCDGEEYTVSEWGSSVNVNFNVLKAHYQFSISNSKERQKFSNLLLVLLQERDSRNRFRS